MRKTEVKQRLCVIALALALSVSMVACASLPIPLPQLQETEPETVAPMESTPATTEGGTIKVTLDRVFFGNKTEEGIRAEAEAYGFSGCEVSEEGHVTYTMNEEQYENALAMQRRSINQAIAEMLAGEKAVESFVSVNYNDDYSAFTIKVYEGKFTAWDSLNAWTLYSLSAYYQALTGKSYADIDVYVNFIDVDTGDVIDTSSYKKALEEEKQSNKVNAVAVIAKNEQVRITRLCDLTVEYVEIGEIFAPYLHKDYPEEYVADEGLTYIDLCVKYTNKDTVEKNAEAIMAATLIYADHYEYAASELIENTTRDGFRYAVQSSILPEETSYLHYLFEIPNSFIDSGHAMSVILNADGTPYRLVLQVADKGTGMGDLNLEGDEKKGGEVDLGEVIKIPETCSFCIDDVAVSNEIWPSKEGTWSMPMIATEDSTFFDVCLTYTSWAQKGVSPTSAMKATLIIDGDAEVTGRTLIETEDRTQFTKAEVMRIYPLIPEHIRFAFEVPSDVEQRSSEVELLLEIGGYIYTCKIR